MPRTLTQAQRETGKILIAVSEAAMPPLHPGIEPTDENMHVWEIACACQCLSCVEAVKQFLPEAGRKALQEAGDGDTELLEHFEELTSATGRIATAIRSRGDKG